MTTQINLDKQIVTSREFKVGPKKLVGHYTPEIDREMQDKAIDFHAMTRDLDVDKLLDENTVEEAKEKLHNAEDGVVEFATEYIDRLFSETDAKYLKDTTQGRPVNYARIGGIILEAAQSDNTFSGN